MERKYDELSLRELYEIQYDVIPGKDAREFHKALKKYGDGLALCYRYPNLPTIISITSVVILVVSLIVAVWM